MELSVAAFCMDTSGSVCFDDDWDIINSGVIALFSSLAAFAIVFCSYHLAPLYKLKTALFIYIIGLVIAFVFAYSIGAEWLAFFGCAATGLLAIPAAIKSRELYHSLRGSIESQGST